MKIRPPWSRLRWTQPESRTVAPVSAARTLTYQALTHPEK
jgi:hypothetical protein